MLALRSSPDFVNFHPVPHLKFLARGLQGPILADRIKRWSKWASCWHNNAINIINHPPFITILMGATMRSMGVMYCRDFIRNASQSDVLGRHSGSYQIGGLVTKTSRASRHRTFYVCQVLIGKLNSELSNTPPVLKHGNEKWTILGGFLFYLWVFSSAMFDYQRV